MNLWMAFFTVLLAVAGIVACGTIVVGEHSVGVALVAMLGMSLTTFLAIWSLFRSIKPNQGADEFNEIHLRVKEMIDLTPGLTSTKARKPGGVHQRMRTNGSENEVKVPPKKV